MLPLLCKVGVVPSESSCAKSDHHLPCTHYGASIIGPYVPVSRDFAFGGNATVAMQHNIATVDRRLCSDYGALTMALWRCCAAADLLRQNQMSCAATKALSRPNIQVKSYVLLCASSNPNQFLGMLWRCMLS